MRPGGGGAGAALRRRRRAGGGRGWSAPCWRRRGGAAVPGPGPGRPAAPLRCPPQLPEHRSGPDAAGGPAASARVARSWLRPGGSTGTAGLTTEQPPLLPGRCSRHSPGPAALGAAGRAPRALPSPQRAAAGPERRLAERPAPKQLIGCLRTSLKALPLRIG